MTFTSKPKRKNDDPPRFPAWVVVVVAIGLVIIAFLLFRPAGRTTSTVEPLPPCIETSVAVSQTTSPDLDPLELTATKIVQMATAAAPCEPVGGTLQSGVTTSGDLDPAFLTATGIMQQATAGAQSSDADPLLLTATALIEQATQGVANPDLDPFAMTATAIVQQVTETASTPAP
ncbi:MAG: hypothetical protein LCI00_23895 [Chloroflexi bacterium]|nr:hypothetical protein [Chloroflexota bacterium]MCC6896100.1 hypothetical protein [Anaerolineae bacterium]